MFQPSKSFIARTWFAAAFLFCGMSLPVANATAQAIRGTVTERSTGLPIGGVLMTLVHADSTSVTVVTALTRENGAFILRASQPGSFRVLAKRIGVRRFDSDVIDLASGQEIERSIELEALAYQLPAVAVLSESICSRRNDRVGDVAALWDEARTALAATQVSQRDRLVRARVVRYLRELDARSLRVESERMRRETTGVVDRPFISLGGDVLSRSGYWRILPNDSIAYHAPDADVLLSASFARDHCFDVANGRGQRAGLTGLVFEPARDRDIPDVRGTIWLDARTFELRFVDFAYSRLPFPTNNGNIGGEVHFTRLPSGAWIVERWFIRMPRYADRPTTRSTGVPGARPIVEYRLTGLLEEGGTVTVEQVRPPSQ